MFRFRFATMAMLTLTLVAIAPFAAARSAHAQNGERCFTETGQCISGRFRQYWEQNGGLAVFGYPITAAQNERNRDTGEVYLTQWFERNRLELHPQNNAPYDVLLGRLGDDALKQRGIDWRLEPRAERQANCLYFDITGHTLCDQARNVGFRTYWQTHGLEFDGRRGFSYAESLALFGQPLTEPRVETNDSGDTVLTQWFERARFEWHPDQPNPSFRVLLGLLGNELRDPAQAISLPIDAPWVRTGSQIVAVADNTPRITVGASDPQFGAPSIRVAPNGLRFAYFDFINGSEMQLVIVEIGSGARRTFPLGANGTIVGGAWEPDARRFAFSVVFGGDQLHNELRMLDLDSGGVFVQRSEATNLVLTPFAWNSGGLFATNLLWGSDAPPQDVFTIDPSNGNAQQIIDSTAFEAAVSTNGQSVAYVSGSRPIMATPDSALTVFDRSRGQTRTLVSQRPGLISNLDWTPNGQKLVHVRTPNYESDPASIHVTNADGSGEQVLRLEGGAFPGRIQDVAWRNNTTLLILTRDGPRDLTVFEVSLSNFHPAAARQLQTFSRNDNFVDEFVYMPR